MAVGWLVRTAWTTHRWDTRPTRQPWPVGGTSTSVDWKTNDLDAVTEVNNNDDSTPEPLL
jgi:hypothetical protein